MSSSDKDGFQKLIDACEAEVRSGNVQGLSSRLAKMNVARIPRAHRLPLANICRRAGLTAMGLRFLSPLMSPARDSDAPSSAELAEYAVLLQRLGAVGEALGVLEKVDTAVVPEAFLYRTFCHMSRWDYASAVNELKSYLDADLDAYSRRVGQVNLAVSFFYTGEIERSEELLNSMLNELKPASEFARLNANCFELRSQVYIEQGHLAKAEKDLDAAMAVFGAEQTVDQLFTLKGYAHVNAIKSGDPRPLELFREEALRRKHWESVRDTDLLRLKIRFDDGLFNYLYTGTPFPAYRERILTELNQPAPTSPFILGESHWPCLDLMTSELDGRRVLNRGKISHQVLEILLRDFYRPFRLSALFAEIFPNQRFDLDTSKDRVHKALRRARKNWAAQGLPLTIAADGGNYRLKIQGDLAVRILRDRQGISGPRAHMEKLLLQLSPEQTFSSRQAREILELSPSSFKRFAAWAVNEGHLLRFGQGPSVFYQVAPRAPRKDDSK
jgi:tetratricopeptide (TPR) repeat protein